MLVTPEDIANNGICLATGCAVAHAHYKGEGFSAEGWANLSRAVRETSGLADQAALEKEMFGLDTEESQERGW